MCGRGEPPVLRVHRCGWLFHAQRPRYPRGYRRSLARGAWNADAEGRGRREEGGVGRVRVQAGAEAEITGASVRRCWSPGAWSRFGSLLLQIRRLFLEERVEVGL